MLKNSIKLFAIALISMASVKAKAQTGHDNPEKLQELILEKDSLFWQAYNSCAVDKMLSFLSEDLEFYHDKNGLTKGLDNFGQLLRSGLCADGAQLRREAQQETVQVFPLNGIGAIISGDHKFYIGNRPDSEAKFTHVWTVKNNEWKMSRVLSYDHKTIAYQNQQKAVVVDDETLSKYVGNYLAPNTGEVSISKVDGGLKISIGPMEMVLVPESSNIFFNEQRPLSFEFVSNEADEVIKMIVRENGNVVEEAKRL